MDIKHKLKCTLAGISLALYAATPVMADDTEIYTSGALGAPTVKPNIMFLVDTSGSMGTNVSVTTKYDYLTAYAGSCAANTIYYVDDGTLPKCFGGNKDYFDRAAFKCDNAVNFYDLGVITGPLGSLETAGYYSDQLAQRVVSGPNSSWRAMDTSSASEKSFFVECQNDSGLHGESSSSNPYIADNKTGGWTNTAPADPTNPHPVWSGGVNYYTVYDGNYLNYLENPPGSTLISRLDVVKEAVQDLVDSNDNFYKGLIVFDSTTNQWEGGAIQYPTLSTGLPRNDFDSRLKNLTADGSTPLSEAYYEALLYFRGIDVQYGLSGAANPPTQIASVTTLSGNKIYRTPIIATCQNNYIVVLSDGAPQQDYLTQAQLTTLASGTTNKISNNPGTLVGSCNTDPNPGILDGFGLPIITLSLFNKNAATSATATNDNCLDELAGWAFNNDIGTLSVPEHDGNQKIGTYTIGFDFNLTDPDLVAAEQLMRDTAAAGGGKFYTADDKTSLSQAFAAIVGEILKINSTFSSPAVSVNAFNRATNLDDLYFTLFKPTDGEHWIGNFKKFKLKFFVDTTDVNGNGDFTERLPFIADQKGNPAIDDATGFFLAGSESYWTTGADSPDGKDTETGGAASRLTNTRNVYTMADTYSTTNGVMIPDTPLLTDGSNALDKVNASVTDVMLNIVGFPDLYVGTTYRDGLLDWAMGIDVKANGITGPAGTAARREMGDPLHAEPALVQYGLLPGDVPDLVSYVATNDGYLHAINTVNGSEYFSFVPQEMLSKLDNIFQNTGINGKQYGLDGNVVPWINDTDKDGTIETGESVYIYFGMRRGGRNIYSMDVTNRNAPELRWVIEGGSGDYADLGQTWSAVNVEKILIAGVERTVLIFGGGYDVAQDSKTLRSADTEGMGIYIVDADDGKLLWRAGPDAGAVLTLTDMKYSIPARIKPLDIDGDGYIDRLYTGDTGGQLWRMDIDNSLNTASALSVKGGRIADLAVDGSAADTRRFYYPPDTALILQEGQAPFVAVVATSGYRAHPLNTTIEDRVYMLRDFDVYDTPSSYTTLTESDLFDTTDNTIGEGAPGDIITAITGLNTAEGWFISLEELDGSFVGEKGLAEPLIINGVVIFTTYMPPSASINPSACEADDGSGSLYFVNVADGTPTYDTSADGRTREDRKTFLERGGIPPTPTVIITDDGTPTLCVGTECSKSGEIGSLQKMYWFEK